MKIMEVCGTHTAAIFKGGIRSLMKDEVNLISGPGCPVCVTPTSFIDKCISESKQNDSILYSFGDMFKVHGSDMSLAEAKSHGANIELMYSPFEALTIAQKYPDKRVIVAAVGFETTVPVYAMLLEEALKKGIDNLKFITSLKSAIPAIDWVSNNEEDVEGFICPGHVSVIIGEEPYYELANKHSKPFMIAGFESEHILAAIDECLKYRGKGMVKNLYSEAVKKNGNQKAQESISKYFDLGSTTWRGLGAIDDSGFYLKDKYQQYDLGSKGLTQDSDLPEACRCADVIRGRIDPPECPLFEKECTPTQAHGPCMVSSEGACGIWYQNR